MLLLARACTQERAQGIYNRNYFRLHIRHIENILSQSHSWSEFHSRLASLGTKEKGDAFELLTKLFLELDPTYATKLRHVWLLRDVPTKVRAQLALPDTDQGIDLIAETRDGE